MTETITNGGMQFVPQNTETQIVYLNFDGEATSYNGELMTISNVVVQNPGLTDERIAKIQAELNAMYAGRNVIFVTAPPDVPEYSTVYIGKAEAFSPYGQFAGLAETIDSGNMNKTDKAFVLLDASAADEQIISNIFHETSHLLGGLAHNNSKNDLSAFAQTVIGSNQSSIITGSATGGGYIVENGGFLANGYRHQVSREGITGNGRYYTSDYAGGTVNGVEIRKGGFLGVLGGTTNDIVLNSGAKVGLFSSYYGGIGTWVESSVRGYEYFTHYGEHNATITQMTGSVITGIATGLDFTGSITVENGMMTNTTIRQGASLYVDNGILSGDTRIIGVLVCDDLVNAAGTITIDISSRIAPKNNSPYIVNFSELQGNDLCCISISSEDVVGSFVNSFGRFLLATGAFDYQGKMMVMIDGQTAGYISDKDAIIYEGNYYKLDTSSDGSLYLLVTNDPCPDLSVYNISISNDFSDESCKHFSPDETIRISVTVKNIGVFDSESCSCSLRIGNDEKLVFEGNVGELKVGEKTTLSFTVDAWELANTEKSWDYSTYQVSVDVDSGKQIRELDEANNKTTDSLIISFANEIPDSVFEYLARDVAYNQTERSPLHKGDIVSKTITNKSLGILETFFFKVDRVWWDDTGFDAYGLVQTDSKGNILKDGNAILACRGTEPTLVADLIADADIKGIGFPQFEKNAQSVNEWLEQKAEQGLSLNFTGHSLGGALSQLFASNYADVITSVVTFNSPGITTNCGITANKVHHYINSGDIVSLAGNQFVNGQYYVFDNITAINELLGISSNGIKDFIMGKHYDTKFFDDSGDYSQVLLYSGDAESLSNPNFSYLTLEHFDQEYAKYCLIQTMGNTRAANQLLTRERVEQIRVKAGTILKELQNYPKWVYKTELAAVLGPVGLILYTAYAIKHDEIPINLLKFSFTTALKSVLTECFAVARYISNAFIAKDIIELGRDWKNYIHACMTQNIIVGDKDLVNSPTGETVQGLRTLTFDYDQIPDMLFNFSTQEFVPLSKYSVSDLKAFQDSNGKRAIEVYISKFVGEWICLIVNISESYDYVAVANEYNVYLNSGNWGKSADGKYLYILDDPSVQYRITLERNESITRETGTFNLSQTEVTVDTEAISIMLTDIDASRNAGGGNDSVVVSVVSSGVPDGMSLTLYESEVEGIFQGKLSFVNNTEGVPVFHISGNDSLSIVYHDALDSTGASTDVNAKLDVVGNDVFISISDSMPENYSTVYSNLDWTNFIIGVSDETVFGDYVIASNAAGFSRIVLVVNLEDDSEHELSAGESFVTQTGKYSLLLQGTDLVFRIESSEGIWDDSIDITPPDSPTINKTVVNEDSGAVKVTASFAPDSVRNEYSLNYEVSFEYEKGRLVAKESGDWFDYTGGITFTQSGAIGFRSRDNADNISPVSTYYVSIVPSAPRVSANITAPTNQDVTITATFGEGSVEKEYSFDQENWMAYTEAIVFTENGTVSFRSANRDKQYSKVTTYTVSNIDRIPPPKPELSIKDAESAGKVEVTATISEDSAIIEYSLDAGKTWMDYTGPVICNKTDKVYFRGRDEAGNCSDIAIAQKNAYQFQDVIANGTSSTSDLNLTSPGWYAISDDYDFGFMNGSISIMNKKKTVASGKIKNGVLTFNKGKNVLLDSSVTYTVVVKNTDKKATGIMYSFTLDAVTVFDKGDNSDDGTLIKTKGAAGDIGQVGTINANSKTLLVDWVGFGDGVDYKAFTLDSAARLAFDLLATDAVGFTLYSLKGKTSKKGVTTYSLTSLQSTSVKANTLKTTKNLLLEAGTYYMAVKSTNAAKGGNADYTISVNDKSMFFTNGNNIDDWTDMKEHGPYGNVGAISAALPGEIVSDWVGFGDEVDYFKLSFGNGISGDTSLHITSTGRISVTVYQLQEKKGVYSLKKIVSKTVNNTGIIKDRFFSSEDDYYICVKSLDAKKGASASYSISCDMDVYYSGQQVMATRDKNYAVSVSSGKTVNGTLTRSETSLFYAVECALNQSILLTVDQNTREAILNDEIEIHFFNENGNCISYLGKDLCSLSIPYNYRKSNVTYIEVAAGQNFTGEASFGFRSVWDGATEVPAPTASADVTSATNGSVLVSAVFSENSAKKEYSLDGRTWLAYTGPVTFTENGTVYFRGKDATGNVSETTQYDVTNIDRIPPAAPTASADVTAMTNSEVRVSAVFSEDSARQEYSFDNNTWLAYTGPVKFIDNGVVFFRGTDEAGNTSTITICTVNNIDRIPPAAPTASADVTAMTNSEVRVSAVFSEDSAKKEYSLDGRTWFEYTGSVTFIENGSVFFRGKDAAGNVSEVTQYEVGNIDSIAPDAPVATADVTAVTNGEVQVSAVFSEDSVKKEYSLDGRTWFDYTGPISFTENGSVSFRGIDEFGNISEITTYTVSNIDVIAPEAPVATADVTAATNGDVTVSAVFSEDSAKKEYSLDGITWTAYTGPVTFTENSSVSFRGIDELGNISEITTYTVNNIDKVPPDAPVATADTTAATNGNVQISAVFSEDSAKKEYSLDGKTWFEYTEPVTFTENGSVFFRGKDASGNVSEVTQYEVGNIDRISPVIQLAEVDQESHPKHVLTATTEAGLDIFYSTDNVKWVKYNGPIEITSNGTYYFKTFDAAGNITTAEYVVANFETDTVKLYSAGIPVSSAPEMSGALLGQSMLMEVNSGGIAYNTSIADDGCMIVSSCGTAKDTTMTGDGEMYVYEGGSAINTIVSSGDLKIGSYYQKGGTVSGVKLESGACMHIYDGGIASDVTTEYGVWANGGTIDSLTLQGTGYLFFYGDGASATNITAQSNTRFLIYTTPNSYIQGTRGGEAFEFRDGIVSDYTVPESIDLIVRNGTAKNVTIGSGCSFTCERNTVGTNIQVNSGGYVNNLKYLGTTPVIIPEINQNGICSANVSSAQTSWNNQYLKIGEGTIITDFKLNGGWAIVNSGGIVSSAILRKSGDHPAILLISSGAKASETSVESGGTMTVFSGGTAVSTTVGSGGSMFVSSGGQANRTDVVSGGSLYFGEVSANGINNSGSAGISRCIFRDNKGFLNGGAVINNGTMMLNETTFSGNSATYGGAIYNNGDIVLKDVSLLTGTDTVLNTADGKIMLAGTNKFAGAVQNAGVITIDISENTSASNYVIDNFAMFSGGTYQIMVSDSQAAGTYRIAAGASGFNSSITVINTSDVTLGLLTVNGTFTHAGTDYSLSCDAEGNLTMTLVPQILHVAMQSAAVPSSIPPIEGTSGNDILFGDSGNDALSGGGGDDIFCFGKDWGVDSVEQLPDGTVTLWLESGDESYWDESLLTYDDGANRICVSGVSADKVTLRFGDDGSAQYAALESAGAFALTSSQTISEEAGKGLLATL